MSPNSSPPHSLDPAAKAFLLQQWNAHPITEQLTTNLEQSAAGYMQRAVAARRTLPHNELVFLLEAVAARQELLEKIKTGNI